MKAALAALRARYAVRADPLRSERRVELLVLACAALLLVLLAYLAVRVALGTDVTPILPAPDSVRVATLSRPAPLPAEAREALRERPLFWAGRRGEEAPEPVPEPVQKEDKPARRLKNVSVWGIYGSGEVGGVILSVRDEERRLAVGEELDGWRLERVTGNSAVFVSAGSRDERELLPRVIEGAAADGGAAVSGGRSASAAAGTPAPRRDAGSAGSAGEEEPQLTLGGGPR